MMVRRPAVFSFALAFGGLASFAALARFGLSTRRMCGFGGRCEPEAVAPEPSSPGGELGSVGAGSVDPRARFACCLAFRRSAFCWSVSGLRFIAFVLPPVYWFA